MAVFEYVFLRIPIRNFPGAKELRKRINVTKILCDMISEEILRCRRETCRLIYEKKQRHHAASLKKRKSVLKPVLCGSVNLFCRPLCVTGKLSL